MKRPVTLLLVATLLASTSAFAAKNDESIGKAIKREVIRNENGNRGNDRGGNHRGNDHRGNDRDGNHRGNDHRGNDRGGNHRDNDRGHDRRDDRRHDWNGHRNDRNDRNGRNDNRHDWNGHRDNRHDNRGWDRHRNDWHNHPNYWDNRRHDRRDYARFRYHFGHYRPPLGYYHRVWHRGDYLPRAWYGHTYIVYDWRPYRLYAPPYGYHWVRVGNDVVLTAIATGLVLDVLYDIWY
jgi:Ni/Co efflux regulator RcnB